MQNRNILLLIVGCALALGVAGDWLFRRDDGTVLSWGTNVFGWTLLCCAALILIARRSGVKLNVESGWFFVPLLFFASTFAWRECGFLRFWDGALMFVTAALIATRCLGPCRIASAGYTEYIRLFAIALGQTAAGPVLLASQDFRPRPPVAQIYGPPATVLRAWPMLFRGVLLSVVPLFVFGALFVNADAVFAGEIQALFNWDFTSVASNVLFTFLFFALAVGILRLALVQAKPADQTDPREGRSFPLEAGDIAVALVLIDCLFVAFVVVQFKFLFGGEAVIHSVAGLNYASYARGGFFELAWVAGLALPVLLFAHWVAQIAPLDAQKRVKVLTGLLVALLFVIVASAFKRMAMYEDAWGMTEKRFFVSVFIGVITAIFIWFLATAWRGAPKHFAFGVLIVSMLTIGALDLINPDRIVVQTDIARGKLICFDAQYLTDLGADAAPALIQSISSVAPAEQPQLAQNLIAAYASPKLQFQEWSTSLALAHNAVKSQLSTLSALASKVQQSGCNTTAPCSNN